MSVYRTIGPLLFVVVVVGFFFFFFFFFFCNGRVRLTSLYDG